MDGFNLNPGFYSNSANFQVKRQSATSLKSFKEHTKALSIVSAASNIMENRKKQVSDIKRGFRTDNTIFQHTIEDINRALEQKLNKGKEKIEYQSDQLSNDISQMLDKMYSQELGEANNGQEVNTASSDSFNSQDDDLSQDAENAEDRKERKKQMRIRNKQRQKEEEHKLTNIARLVLQNLG